MFNTPHRSFHGTLILSPEENVTGSISQMRKIRPRKIQKPSQSFGAYERQRQDSSQACLTVVLLTTRAQQGHHGSWAQAPLRDSGLLSYCPAVGLSPEPATQSQQGDGLSGRVASGDPACHGNDFEDPREYTPTQAMQGYY